MFTSDSTKLPKANISVIASATDKQAPPFTWILDVFHRRPPLCDWICQPSLTFLLATVYHKQLRSQGLGNAAVLRFTVLIGVLSQPLVKRLRTQIWASESASAVWCVSAVFVFAREWPYEPSEPVGEVCSEPRKRSALGQARGAQAKPELNVAKPHLFRERSDLGLVFDFVWGLGRDSPQGLAFSFFERVQPPPLFYISFINLF